MAGLRLDWLAELDYCPVMLASNPTNPETLADRKTLASVPFGTSTPAASPQSGGSFTEQVMMTAEPACDFRRIPKPLRDLVRQAVKAGATVDMGTLPEMLTLDAPRGYVWVGGDTRGLYVNGADAFGNSWWDDAAVELADDLALGLRICDAEESASVEYDFDDGPWVAPAGSPGTIAIGGAA